MLCFSIWRSVYQKKISTFCGEKKLPVSIIIQAAKCCCGTGFFYDFPKQKCLVSANVGFMFGRLNNGWSHVAVYGFAYPMLVLVSWTSFHFNFFKLYQISDSNCSAKRSDVGNGKARKTWGRHTLRKHFFQLKKEKLQFFAIILAESNLSNDLASRILRLVKSHGSVAIHNLVLHHRRRFAVDESVVGDVSHVSDVDGGASAYRRHNGRNSFWKIST